MGSFKNSGGGERCWGRRHPRAPRRVFWKHGCAWLGLCLRPTGSLAVAEAAPPLRGPAQTGGGGNTDVPDVPGRETGSEPLCHAPRPVLTWGAGLGGRPDVRRPCRLTPRCLPGVSQPHPPPTASGCRWEGGKNQRRRAGRDESGKSRSAAHAPAEPRTWRGRPMHPEGSPPRPWGALAGQGARPSSLP